MKNPTIKQEKQLEFYNVVAPMSRDETLAYCTKLISEARVPNHTLMNQLTFMSKDRIIIAMNNFIMKGQGYGV
jgi:hypothetical protein